MSVCGATVAVVEVAEEQGRQELGRAIRSRRQAAGLTQRVVATGAGITVQYLSDIERGRRLPSLDVLARVAFNLGTNAAELLTKVPPYGG